MTPIYYRQNSIGLSYFSGGSISNPQASVQVSNSAGDAGQPKNTTTYYLSDQVGSARMLVAAGGWPVSSDIYYPFGQEQSAPIDNNHYKFTGKERDTESGFDYFGARYYASNDARWLTPDPSGLFYADPSDPQSLNLYNYGLNNPVINTDPTGLDCVYFNDAGNGVESIDHHSSSGECSKTGGDWVNGTTSAGQIHYNASNDTFSIQSSSTWHEYNTTASAPGSQADGTMCYGDCDTQNGYQSSWKIPGFTVQLGLSGNFGFWGPFTGTGFFGVILDSHGHVGGYSGGGGGVSAGEGGSLGVQLGDSNGGDICAMGGPFVNGSATGGLGVGGTIDGFAGYGNGPNGVVSGGSVTAGIAGGVDASATITGTHIVPFGSHKCINGKIK